MDYRDFPKGGISNKMSRLPIRDLDVIPHGIIVPKFNGVVEKAKINLVDKKEFKEMHRNKRDTNNYTGSLKL